MTQTVLRFTKTSKCVIKSQRYQYELKHLRSSNINIGHSYAKNENSVIIYSPHVISNLNAFLSSAEQKRRFFNNILRMMFLRIFFQNIFFYEQKNTVQFWNDMNKWQTFNFWLEYPFHCFF